MEETARTYDDLIGRTAYDCDGDRIGEIKDIYYDDVSGRPEWVEVKAGLFTGTRLAPIDGAMIRDDNDVQLAHDTERIKTAPDFDLGDVEHLDADWEQQLYAHYGYSWDSTTATEGYGYGTTYGTQRFDEKYEYETLPAPTAETTEEIVADDVEEVPVDATVEIPVHTTVRLRRYQTQRQRTETRQVEVPVTETEEHVEVTDIDAEAETPR